MQTQDAGGGNTLKKINELYYNHQLENKERFIKAYDQVSILFEIQEMIEHLDLQWMIHKQGVEASVFVQELQQRVSLYMSKNDMFQIPLAWLLNDSFTEQEEYKIFFDLLSKKESVFIDIGANVGWYSILASLWGSKVFAFEPIAETYRRLLKNLKLNACSTVKAFPIALGETQSKEKFYYHNQISGASSRANLDYLSDGNAVLVECEMNTLDSCFANEPLSRIDLIKCDVEGGELFVFKGGRETIKKYRPYVMCEMLRKWSAKFQYHPNEIIQLFTDLEYNCIALKKDAPGTGYKLDQILDSTEETNFLFVPKERYIQLPSFLTLH